MHDERIAELETKVADLTALVERLTATGTTTATGTATVAATTPVTTPGTTPGTTPDASATALQTIQREGTAVAADDIRSSRRGMLKLAGAAAAGAVVVAVAGNASPAAAVTGDPLKVGTTSFGDAAEVTTLFNGSLSVVADTAARQPFPSVGGSVAGLNLATAVDAIDRGGVLGISSQLLAPGPATAHGVLGYASASSNGSAVYGRSDVGTAGVSAGLRASSIAGPAVQLVPVAPGAPSTGTWTVGAIQPDTTGRLFYCIASGTPGTWRELSLPGLTIISPVRVYDSRLAVPTPGKLSTGTSRVVSIKDSRDPNTGQVLVPDIVPVRAVAIVGNLTITKTVGSGGYLSVVPGDATVSSGSSINWFGPNQDLANSLTAKVDASRQVKVFCGGDSATDFVIDVTGYYV